MGLFILVHTTRYAYGKIFSLALCLLGSAVSQGAQIARKKAVVGLFGVVARSIVQTWPQIKKMVVEPLEQSGYQVDIAVANIDVGSAPVDGVMLKQSDVTVIPYQHYHSMPQKKVDQAIRQACQAQTCSLWSHTRTTSNNALRQMHAEYRLGKMVSAAKDYELAVVIGPDFYPLLALSMQEVVLDEHVYTSEQSDAGGYTNGFYLGKPKQIAKILMRFEDFANNKGITRSLEDNYETILMKYCHAYKIPRRIITMPFCKMRANRVCRWPGGAEYSPAILNLAEPEKKQLQVNICHLQNRYKVLFVDIIPQGILARLWFVHQQRWKMMNRYLQCFFTN